MKQFIRENAPEWAAGSPLLSIDGDRVLTEINDRRYMELQKAWKKHVLRLSITKKIKKEFLPGSKLHFALLDGPVVLAALSDREEKISADAACSPMIELQYIGGREWQTNTYSVETAFFRFSSNIPSLE